MKKSQTKTARRKGFTIVELVIVIAVIAILAAVLIPTFSSLIRKSNLSADKQAVREMNIALAADEELHGRCQTLEQAMQVLANAGYNSDNWVCLTQGYEVYWWKQENRLVLYNSSSAEVEYPTEYDKKVMFNAANTFFIYNENNLKAVAVDMKLSSNAAASSFSSITSDTSTSSTAKASLGSLNDVITGSGATSSAVRDVLGITNSSQTKVYGTKEMTTASTTGNNAYAAMQVVSVSDTGSAILKNNGEVKENVFYISTNISSNATSDEIAAAEIAAGTYVYTVFTQINTNQVDDDVVIMLAPGTKINVSDREWAPVEEFSGYFGTSDASNPIVIDGAALTDATSYAKTVKFTGSGSKYFITGFFGTVYGESTIENVTFKNLHIAEPAMDYALTEADISGNKVNNRNTVAVIGGITDGGSKAAKADVLIKNVTVDSSCTVECGADGAGLIGYIGSAESSGALDGTIKIENCNVGAKVVSTYVPKSSGYGPLGGLIGFFCRCNNNLTTTIADCTFNGSVDGTQMVGAAIGNLQGTPKVIFSGNNDFSGAALGTHSSPNAIGGVIGTTPNATIDSVTFGGNITINSTLPAYTNGGNKYNLNKQKIN